MFSILGYSNKVSDILKKQKYSNCGQLFAFEQKEQDMNIKANFLLYSVFLLNKLKTSKQP